MTCLAVSSRRTYSVICLVALIASVSPSLAARGNRTPRRPSTPVSSTNKASPPTSITIEPSEVNLIGSRSSQRLLVTGRYPDSLRDMTDNAIFVSKTPGVVTVSSVGVVRPVADGIGLVTTRLRSHAKTWTQVRITVKGYSAERGIQFANQITPILTRAGCNSSNCHGSPAGKGGFKLSLFGYEPDRDYRAIALDRDGARINKQKPEDSLVLKKPTMQVPHKGGVRFAIGSWEYATLLDWIRAGALEGKPDDPRIDRIAIKPDRRVLTVRDQKQRLLVTAFYSDGTSEDVTHKSRFTSDEDTTATVNADGIVSAGPVNGEAPIMVRFGGLIGCANVVVAESTGHGSYPRVPIFNAVDEKVFAKLKALHIVPSDLCGDAMFLRRVSLDLIGTSPTVEESRRFLADPSPAKRAKLIDDLLERAEYADFWAMKWADLLRVNARYIRPEGARSYHQWLREQFKNNTPLDSFARSILIADGSNFENGPVSYYRISGTNEQRASDSCQVFMGVRIECARCHNHPFERWTQTDFYGLVGFFNRFQTRGGTRANEIVGVLQPAVRIERHPTTNRPIKPHVLDGPPLDIATGADPRRVFADWLVSPENPYFARTMVNRIWRSFFGRGIVEPVDDFRATNPPSNAELLDFLAKELIEHKFDQKHIIRLICNSRTYQLSPGANETNHRDVKYFSRAYPKRLVAEVLLDAICQVTGVPESYPNNAGVTRAIQVYNNLMRSPFLDVFNRHSRMSIHERDEEGSIPQILYLINNPAIQDKLVVKGGRIDRLIAEGKTNAQILEELTIASLCRLPTTEESRKVEEAITASGEGRKVAIEDLLWALITSREFQFNH